MDDIELCPPWWPDLLWWWFHHNKPGPPPPPELIDRLDEVFTSLAIYTQSYSLRSGDRQIQQLAADQVMNSVQNLAKVGSG